MVFIFQLHVFFVHRVDIWGEGESNAHNPIQLCDVAVGRALSVDTPDPTLSRSICETHNCDSLSLSISAQLDVVVVFNPQQVLPRFILTISTASSPPNASALCKEHSEELKVFCTRYFGFEHVAKNRHPIFGLWVPLLSWKHFTRFGFVAMPKTKFSFMTDASCLCA